MFRERFFGSSFYLIFAQLQDRLWMTCLLKSLLSIVLRIHGLLLRNRKKNALAHCDFSLVHKFHSLHYFTLTPISFQSGAGRTTCHADLCQFQKIIRGKNSDWHFSVALIYVTPYRAKHFITPNKTSRDNFPRKLGGTHLKKTQGSILEADET